MKNYMLSTMASWSPLFFTAIGIALKALWDAYTYKKREIELQIWKLKAGQLERRLSEFYWPIYLRLQRDNVVWEKILEREHPSDHERRDLAYQIEQDILLPNHSEIVKIIESNIHLAGADKEFEKHLMDYMRHVDVYKSCRAAGIKDKDPIYFGEPYPQGFFKALTEKLQTYQSEYERLLNERVA
jgi:hypothetical protein